MELLLSHQTQFVQLFRQIHRKADPNLFMKSLQSLIVSLRKTIMTEKNAAVQQAHFTILKLLFKLIVYTRDIFGGLGEREMTYCMLFIWKYHFPLPTAQCLYKIVMPVQSSEEVMEPSYGSWRDIKGMCDFVRKHSEKGEEDPFIETCIGLMNHQLASDITCWKDALKRDSYPVPSEVGVSLVSRWIPRETSAHAWLFDRGAIQWIRAFRPEYLKTVNNSYERFERAFRKGKKEYRQHFTTLSKALDTLQIKQCSQHHRWNEIDPKHIPMNAMTKQQHALINITRKPTIDRNICAMKIQHWWLTHGLIKRPIFIEMGTIIKQALTFSHPFRIERLWSSVLSQIPDMQYMIPVLDLSLFHTDVESFYNALGMALAIACKSTIFGTEKRLLAFDTTAHFVSLSGNLGQMLDVMKPFFYEHHIGSDLENAFSMFSHGTLDSHLDETLLSHLVFVVFSNVNCKRLADARKVFSGSSLPSILYWGGHLSSETTSIFPQFVGNSNHTLSRIAQLPSDSWKCMTPFIFIQYLLSHKRYDPIDTYFDTLRGA